MLATSSQSEIDLEASSCLALHRRRCNIADRVGQQFGNYRLVSLLGQGGYAEVYLGQHVRLDLQAAIKVLHTHLTGSEAEHFQQEAETIARLAHPSIIRVFDFDVQDDTPFLVMDFAPNGSLRQRYPKGSLVPLPQIVSYVKQVSAALQYAHDKKFIHRDVKPENMLIGQYQEVLLSDFGIATIAHSTSSLNVGSEGASGTLTYMAPEQIEGHPRQASDQYALGVVAYEWLCGERPFDGSVSELIAQHVSMPPLPLRERVPTIPAEIEQVVLRALAKDPKARFASVADFAKALEQASQRVLIPTEQLASELPDRGQASAISYETVAVAPYPPVLPMETTSSAEPPVGAFESTIYPGSAAPHSLATPLSGTSSDTPQSGRLVAPKAAVVPPPLEPTTPVKRRTKHLSRMSAVLLIGLAVLVVAGGILGSLSLLAHFGMIGTHNSAITPVRGGTWTEESWFDPAGSVIPNNGISGWLGAALYLPLFYADGQGQLHPDAVREIPTVQNGDISADATTWTFHLRPHLVWSDGQPYDARDVDFTWKLVLNPKFGANTTQGFDLISSADVSADYLTITFHLKHAYAPFLSLWVDGAQAPLPAHQFGRMAPEAIMKSSEDLNHLVTSGPFLLSELVPGDHVTLVRNPRYYRAKEGLPYLDKLIFRVVEQDAILHDLQAGTTTSALFLETSQVPALERLANYSIVTSATSANFEGMYFNFHNTILASHLEVRQAMAMAIDHQALIQARHGIATPLCTDHGSFYHPGYEVAAPCPVFDPAAANKLLEDNGWVKGADGVRTRDGQRLEFEYSANVTSQSWRIDTEAIIQRNFQALGIKLDIQNYPQDTFFGSLVPGGKASPPTGAVAGRYDIAEWQNGFGFDPDDSSILACDQFPPNGGNLDFYCNPALDALYKQELATADPELRQQLFNQIHEIYLTQLPFIMFYSPLDLTIVRKGTHNYLPSPIDASIIMSQWWCDNGKC